MAKPKTDPAPAAPLYVRDAGATTDAEGYTPATVAGYGPAGEPLPLFTHDADTDGVASGAVEGEWYVYEGDTTPVEAVVADADGVTQSADDAQPDDEAEAAPESTWEANEVVAPTAAPKPLYLRDSDPNVAMTAEQAELWQASPYVTDTGQPLYLCTADPAGGPPTHDGAGGIWHVYTGPISPVEAR